MERKLHICIRIDSDGQIHQLGYATMNEAEAAFLNKSLPDGCMWVYEHAVKYHTIVCDKIRKES